MAGIGFELRKLLESGTYLGVVKAYGYAGLISAGPWVLSICGVFAIGLIRLDARSAGTCMQQFQVSVTYLIVSSFIVTSPVQLTFTRFLADEIFKKNESEIAANVTGVLTFVFLISGILASLATFLILEESLLYRLEMISGVVVLSGTWIVMSIVSAIREYMRVLVGFLLGYSTSVVSAFGFRNEGLEGLLAGYLIGQLLLFFYLLLLVFRRFPADQLIRIDFLGPSAFYPRLALISAFFSMGMWVDKFIFWWNPHTSVPVIGPLRVSDIYDLPIFLAYLCIIPGMASFLVRVETDFADRHKAFFDSLEGGASLAEITALRDDMVDSVRRGLKEILKIQGMSVIVIFATGPQLLDLFGIPNLYRILLNVDVVAVSVQVMLLALLNFLSYLDLQRAMLKLGMFFFCTNTALTGATQVLGPSFYGYGFALSVIATTLLALTVLSDGLNRLIFRTFMLQRVVL
ncbi:exopolysaccharide Pel transporter PelG [Methyloterricola oryzae]|uniref:exopolysaccharide Pel transporter PelG n=1 Tax=Methyloterricola oryzae TaxID=1495050 RepID=UPI0005EB3FF2|nr:exopolysaccharide Pel transporter PelG [Methyloterricola oryzae]